MRFSQAETKALRRGSIIARERRNGETGELYFVDVKLSWDKLYYSCGAGWHRTPKLARLELERLAS